MSNPSDNTPEVWKPVPNYEGLYAVSNIGRVRREVGRHCLKVRILKYRISTTGYPEVRLRNGGKLHPHRIHRFVALAFIPPIEGKRFVNHKDGIKTHCWESNLEWVTQQENMDHAYGVLGFSSTGENNPAAILTEADVLEIRQLLATNHKCQALANKFGVTYQTIWQIKNGLNWKHLL